MTDTDIVNVVTGSLLPLLIAVIQRKSWSDQLRFTVALVVYVATATFSALFLGDVGGNGLDWRGWIRAFAPIFIAAVTSFQLVWKRTLASTIERATTP